MWNSDLLRCPYKIMTYLSNFQQNLGMYNSTIVFGQVMKQC